MAGCASVNQNNSTARNSSPTSHITPTSTVPRDPCTPAVGPDLPVPKSLPPPIPTNGSQPEVLWGIAMDAADDGWAVGGIYSQDGKTVVSGLLLHYTRGQWNAVSSPTTQSLHGIQMLSSSEGWAVGEGGVVLHYQGGQWSVASIISQPNASRNPTLYSISMVSTSEGWIVGDSGITVHYSSGSWVVVEHPKFDVPDLFGISMVSADEGWAVGLGLGGEGAIEHYHAGAWEDAGLQVNTLKASLPLLTSITMVSASEGWAVGTTDLWHYCQGEWTEVIPASRLPGLWSVAMASAHDGWAVGSGLWHYTGDQWAPAKSTLPLYSPKFKNTLPAPFHTGSLFGVSMVSQNEGWAVGYGYNISGYNADGSPQSQGTGYLIMHYLNGSWNVYSG